MPLLKVGKASSTVAESVHEAEGISAVIINPRLNDAPTSDEEATTAPRGQPQGWQAEAAPVDVRIHQAARSIADNVKPQVSLEPLVPSRSGYVTALPVPFDIYGSGSTRILFLTGLGLSRSSWMPQLEFFARKPEYSCLVIDIRGFEEIDRAIPLKIAGTKQHGRDMKKALEDLGWTEPKSLHVVGFSMGGMVALQMARVCPEYIASLHLVATAAKYRGPESKIVNIVNTLALLKYKSDEEKAKKYLDLLFPPEFLYAHDPMYPEFRNNKERFLQQNKDGLMFAKEQNMYNYYTQVVAYKRHSLSEADLWQVAAKVRFIFVSGAEQDVLIHPDCSRELMVGLNSQGRMYPGGHFIPIQFKDDFNADQEAMMQRALREYQEYPPTGKLCLSDAEVSSV